jgi:hypothetical protein
MLIEIVQAFMTKIMDNGLGTFKSIYINKEQYVRGSLFASASTFFYLVGVKQVATSGWLVIGVMTFATFIGTLFPGIFMKKIEKDKTWTFNVMATSFEEGIEFADKIRELDNSYNIDINTTISYDINLNKVVSCSIDCPTKESSKIVLNLLPEDFSKKVNIPLEI